MKHLFKIFINGFIAMVLILLFVWIFVAFLGFMEAEFGIYTFRKFLCGAVALFFTFLIGHMLTGEKR